MTRNTFVQQIGQVALTTFVLDIFVLHEGLHIIVVGEFAHIILYLFEYFLPE